MDMPRNRHRRRRVRIFPYRAGSRSAVALAQALSGTNGVSSSLVLRRENSRYRYRDGDIVINWGSTHDIGAIPHGFMGIQAAEYLNDPEDVRKAADKLEAFQVLAEEGVRVPRFWERRDDIPFENVRYPIVCRTVLNGHSGRGIILAHSADDIVPAPLYTEYVPKSDEYRVHVFKQPICNKIRQRVSCDECGYPLAEAFASGDHLGPCDQGYETICVQRKARRLDTPDEDVNWQIRNHDNGFVFTRHGFEVPVDVVEQAKASIIALGLDFGAVDIGFNTMRQEATVYEVNCAPGLEGETVNDYANAVRRRFEL